MNQPAASARPDAVAPDVLTELRLDPLWPLLRAEAVAETLADALSNGGGRPPPDPESLARAAAQLWHDRGVESEADLAAWLRARDLDERSARELVHHDAVRRCVEEAQAGAARARDAAVAETEPVEVALTRRFLLSPEFPRLRDRAADKAAQLAELGLLGRDRPVGLDYQSLLAWWQSHRPHLAPEVLAGDRSRDPFADAAAFRRAAIDEYHYVTRCRPASVPFPVGSARLRDQDMATSFASSRSATLAVAEALAPLDELGVRWWARAPVHRATTGAIDPDSVLGLTDLDRLLGSTRTRARLLVHGTYVDPDLAEGGAPTIVAGFRSGASIVVHDIDDGWAPIADLAGAFASLLGTDVRTKLFVSPPGAVTDWHIDPGHGIVLQLHGTRQWLIERDGPAGTAQTSPPLDARLRPGDVVYVPAGFLHRVHGDTDVSVHLTFCCARRSVARRVEQQVADRLAVTDVADDDDPPSPALGSGSARRWRTAVDAHLDRLHRAVDDLDGAALDDGARAAPAGPPRVGSFLAAHASLSIDADTVVVAPEELRTEGADRGETVLLLAPDRSLAAPGWVRPALGVLARRPPHPCRVDALPLPIDDAVVLIRRLVADGFVEVIADGGANAEQVRAVAGTTAEPAVDRELRAELHRLLPHLELAEVVGGGAGGVVLAATDPDGRRVVVKVAADELTPAPFARERLRREGEILTTCHHENLVRALERHETHDLVVVVVERVEGETAFARLQRGPIPPEEACAIIAATAAALSALHDGGFLHGDVKPENVLLDPCGRHRLIDLGLARRWPYAVTRRVSGTAMYQAPECIRPGGQLVPATDVYALGVMAYELLTGFVPFGSPTGDEELILRQQLEVAPFPLAALAPHLPAALSALVMDTLHKSVERRPASASELRRQLEDVAPTTTRSSESVS